MALFNNEYVSKLNRSETNIYVGKFIAQLMNEFTKDKNLLLSIPPVFTNIKNSFVNNTQIRTIDFDNAATNEIFHIIDTIDKWLYWYIRETKPEVNTGIICLNNQINRDADLESNNLITTPYLSFAVSVVRTYYTYDFLLKEAAKIIETLNKTIEMVKVGDFQSRHMIREYQTVTADELLEANKRLKIEDILLNNVQQKSLFVTKINNSLKFQNRYPSFKSHVFNSELNGSFFHRTLYKELALDLFHIGIHEVYDQLDLSKLNYGPFYESRLAEIHKNAEWTYVVHLNLANILLWLLDKQHHSEIFSGPYPEELYDYALNNKKEVL